LLLTSRLLGLQKAMRIGLPVVKTTVSLLSHVRAKKIILAAASAHSIDHLSCSAKSLITLVGAEN